MKIVRKKKRASSFYRTATTVCLCCLPALEDWTGADRKRLALCGKSNPEIAISKHFEEYITVSLRSAAIKVVSPPGSHHSPGPGFNLQTIINCDEWKNEPSCSV